MCEQCVHDSDLGDKVDPVTRWSRVTVYFVERNGESRGTMADTGAEFCKGDNLVPG